MLEADELTGSASILARFRECGAFARANQLRLSFHPDQFVVLNSPNPPTRANSIAELAYQAEVAGWVGADTINIHGGGAYGDKPAALRALRRSIDRLPAAVRSRLTLENDDKVYTPADLLPVCRDSGVPLVYDGHHHRCLPDGLSVDAATDQAAATWNRQPLFHISSPREGWGVISGIQRISRPGRRVYYSCGSVKPVLGGLGISILRTSRGVMTGREAVKSGVGGEVLCNVW